MKIALYTVVFVLWIVFCGWLWIEFIKLCHWLGLFTWP